MYFGVARMLFGIACPLGSPDPKENNSGSATRAD